MVRDTGKSIEAVAEARREEWPYYLPLAEGRRRTRTLPSGRQPLALSRGYYACTPLQTAMGALRAMGVPSSARRSHDFMASPTLPGETVNDRPAR